MSLASDSRKHAQQWFDVTEREARQSALKIAEAWFQLAMDAVALEGGNGNKVLTDGRPASATVH